MECIHLQGTRYLTPNNLNSDVYFLTHIGPELVRVVNYHIFRQKMAASAPNTMASHIKKRGRIHSFSFIFCVSLTLKLNFRIILDLQKN